MLGKILAVAAISLSLLWGQVAQAGVIINNTRVVYLENNGEAIVQLRNMGKNPILIQSWIDDGDVNSKPNTSHVPFNLTPPLARIDPDKGQSLRILRIGGGLRTDRESLFWLNVLEIPAKATKQTQAGDNIMQFSFRSRIKIFYRPNDLSMTPLQAYEKLELRLVKVASGYKVTVKNPSPYYITFRKFDIKMSKDAPLLGEVAKVDDKMVAPNEERSFPLQGVKSALPKGARLFFTVVNDHGGETLNERNL
ncbi:fimbrial biogenesis chaperone [Edaphovirga cremea]|uniref:fimbrial biogenesis chaperone n=1 Tax=Edaphovirga cremea TaxID=2267246 RepID=UPI000DEF2832|nr:molecular chaperone [Edaphovirga cremea]